MKQTTSAGGVVLNPSGEVLVVSQHGVSWSLPKGHIDPGETAKEAAKREIWEEAGVKEVEIGKELGRYQRHRIGEDPSADDTNELKTIIMFLCTTNQTALQPNDANHPEARWVAKNKVAELLTHPKDTEFFKRIEDKLP